MLEAINGFLSGKLLIVLVVGLGTYFTIKTRFVQLRYFLHMFKVFKDSLSSSSAQISSFQALMLSLAGRVGAGNIAGVGVAVTMGGRALSSGCGSQLWLDWRPRLWSVAWPSCTNVKMSEANTRAGRPSTSNTG